jgi:hypothetical protein
MGRRLAVNLAALISAVATVTAIVGAGRSGNLLGATGSTVSLLIGLTAAFAIVGLLSEIN